MTQLAQAEKLLKKLRSDIEVEQERLAVAQNQRKNLEARNKSVLDNIEQEGGLKKRLIAEQAKDYKDNLEIEISLSKKVKSRLLDDISSLNTKKAKVEKEVDDLVSAKNSLNQQLTEDSLKHQNLLDQILKLTAEIRDNETKINDKRTIIRELESQKQDIEADMEILRTEQDNIETEIIERDAQFKAQKQVLDNRLYETNIELKKALDSLEEAQRKDKAFRTEWAEKSLQLDKRTEAVRRMEARVSGAEARIEELKKYDVL